MVSHPGMPFEPDATQVGLARGAADRAMLAAKKTPGVEQIGKWTARELRAFRIEDAARLETLAETPVMLVAEPEPPQAQMLGNGPLGNGPLGDVPTPAQVEAVRKELDALKARITAATFELLTARAHAGASRPQVEAAIERAFDRGPVAMLERMIDAFGAQP